MPHNHPPRCCCENTIGKQIDGTRITDPDQTCTSCIVHGELAALSNPECAYCHARDGHPHTDYCPRVHASGITIPKAMIEGDAQPNAHDVIQAERAEASRRAAGYCTGCGSHGNAHIRGCSAITSQPATRTSQPATQTREPTPSCRHTVIEYDEHGRGTCRLCRQPATHART